MVWQRLCMGVQTTIVLAIAHQMTYKALIQCSEVHSSLSLQSSTPHCSEIHFSALQELRQPIALKISYETIIQCTEVSVLCHCSAVHSNSL